MGKTQILLVDDHGLFREGVARFLNEEPDFVAFHCASVQDGLQILLKNSIDIVLLDYDLGLGRGSEFLARARYSGFTGFVLIVTAGLSDHDAVQFLRAGVSGIFSKSNSPALLVKAIRKVMGKEVWIDERYLKASLLASTTEGERERPVFSERERAVLRGVFEGLINKEIAARLNISETSVKAALQQLFEKTGVRTRGQLVRIALEHYRDQV